MTSEETLVRLLAVAGMETPRETPQFTDEPKLAIYQARFGRHALGQGAHLDPLIAQIKAAAEALERACLFTPEEDASVLARYGDLEHQIDPADFFCYSQDQEPDRDSTIDELRMAPRYWAQVRDCTNGTQALAPREFVYLDGARYEQARIRRESNSSGGALGAARTEDAFERGLYELIERDALMTAWLNNESLPRVGNLVGEAAALESMLNRYRLECRVFDLRGTLNVPAVLALTLDSTGIGPAVTAGLAAAETYATAIPSAIVESISFRRQFRLKQMSGKAPETARRADIVSVETRIAFWSQPDRLAELPHWAAAEPTRNMDELSGIRCPAEQALENLTSAGHSVFAADITRPAVASAGLKASRVIVPQLHPLFISESAIALQSWRVGAIDGGLNPLPHPFA